MRGLERATSADAFLISSFPVFWPSPPHAPAMLLRSGGRVDFHVVGAPGRPRATTDLMLRNDAPRRPKRTPGNDPKRCPKRRPKCIPNDAPAGPVKNPVDFLTRAREKAGEFLGGFSGGFFSKGFSTNPIVKNPPGNPPSFSPPPLGRHFGRVLGEIRGQIRGEIHVNINALRACFSWPRSAPVDPPLGVGAGAVFHRTKARLFPRSFFCHPVFLVYISPSPQAAPDPGGTFDALRCPR